MPIDPAVVDRVLLLFLFVISGDGREKGEELSHYSFVIFTAFLVSLPR